MRVGCSGWQYASWRGTFYPADLPPAQWLSFYVTRFDTVEINSTFYRLPERDTFVSWRRALPAGFVAATKASRYLTHLKRLKDAEAPVDRFFSRATGLGARLGPILYQLPANFRFTEENFGRVRRLLELVPRRGRRHVIEFRDSGWYQPDVFSVINRAGAAVCWHDMPGSEIADSPGKFVYVRFHGTMGKYRGDYSHQALTAWARRLAPLAVSRQVYAYFNNDIDGAAVRNAETLRALCA